MWLTKLLDSISRILPSDPITGIEKSIARLNSRDPEDRLDPDKFYAEAVSHFLGVSKQRAIDICETAVRQGLLKRRVEVLCPDGTVAASADVEAKLPETVTCWKEEGSNPEPDELPTSGLRTLPYYQLNDQATIALYARRA